MDKEQLLYRYFSKNLTPEQEQQFNELLETDSEFKEQFDFEINLQGAIQDTESKNLKSKLIGFEKDISDKTPVLTLRKNNYQKWAMAASVALLFGLGWFGYNSIFSTNYSEIYDSNFQEYPNTVYTITRGDTVESLEREAFSAYESGNYETALQNFELLQNENNRVYLDFYMAHSFLNLGNTKKAREHFQNTIDADTQFIAESHWYLALISIKEKDKENAVKSLKTLTSKFDYQKDKALELLQELE